MVYKRYVRHNGKFFGPYYYSSHRDGKRVVSKYRPQTIGRIALFDVFSIGFVILFFLFIFLSARIDYSQFNRDRVLVGNVISNVSDIQITSYYESYHSWMFLFLASFVISFLFFKISRKRKKNKLDRVMSMSYSQGKEESESIIRRLENKF